MSHDPLCEAPNCTRCFGNFAYCSTHQCICEVVRKARADEREQAAQRVAEFMDSDPVKGETWDEFLDALITAVRGES